jgi:hypothetical protein
LHTKKPFQQGLFKAFLYNEFLKCYLPLSTRIFLLIGLLSF